MKWNGKRKSNAKKCSECYLLRQKICNFVFMHVALSSLKMLLKVKIVFVCSCCRYYYFVYIYVVWILYTLCIMHTFFISNVVRWVINKDIQLFYSFHFPFLFSFLLCRFDWELSWLLLLSVESQKLIAEQDPTFALGPGHSLESKMKIKSKKSKKKKEELTRIPSTHMDACTDLLNNNWNKDPDKEVQNVDIYDHQPLWWYAIHILLNIWKWIWFRSMFMMTLNHSLLNSEQKHSQFCSVPIEIDLFIFSFSCTKRRIRQLYATCWCLNFLEKEQNEIK